MRNVFISLFIFATITALSMPAIAGAAGDGPLKGGIVPCGNTVDPETGLITDQCGFCDIYNLGHNIVQFLLFNVSIPLATIMFLYGGILFVVSGGSEEKRSKAKDAIKYAVIGLLIAFGAILIIDTIITVLANPDLLKNGDFGPWRDVNFCKN